VQVWLIEGEKIITNLVQLNRILEDLNLKRGLELYTEDRNVKLKKPTEDQSISEIYGPHTLDLAHWLDSGRESVTKAVDPRLGCFF